MARPILFWWKMVGSNTVTTIKRNGLNFHHTAGERVNVSAFYQFKGSKLGTMWLLLWKEMGSCARMLRQCRRDKRPSGTKWSIFLITNLRGVIPFKVSQHGKVQFSPNKMYYHPINRSHLSKTVLQFIKTEEEKELFCKLWNTFDKSLVSYV